MLIQEAAIKMPQVPTIRYHLAAALAKNGRAEEARQELKRLLRDHEEFPEADAAQALLARLGGA